MVLVISMSVIGGCVVVIWLVVPFSFVVVRTDVSYSGYGMYDVTEKRYRRKCYRTGTSIQQ